MKRLLLAAVLGLLLLSSGAGVGVSVEGTSSASLTIYNTDLALVEETRQFTATQPEETVKLNGITKAIVPDSVSFHPENPSVGILQQEFVHELVSRERLLNAYLGKEIEVVLPRTFGTKMVRGTLLSLTDALVIKDATGKIQLLPLDAEVQLAQAPEMATKPTLRWFLHSESPGEIRGQLSYLTRGLSWTASYNAVLDEAETQMEIHSWVNILNTTGVTFQNSKVNLIAGQLQLAERDDSASNVMIVAPARAEGKALVPQQQFEAPTGAFEYYQYALKRHATLRDNQRTQLGFYSALGVPTTKRFVVDSSRGEPVWVKFDLTNSEQNNLGLALPAGLVRVYKRDATGMKQLIGEDRIQHWAKGEKTTLTVGVAFDLKAERKVINHELVRRDDRGNETYRDTIEVTLRNSKDTDVQIEVIENLPGAWKIVEQSQDYEKLDSHRILFKVLVPKESETKLTYSMEYTY